MAKTQPVKQANSERRYGLFSLLSLIVGVVIGSGIFVKNQGVIETAGSTTNALISWGIVSFIIILMVFAFVEIASSTKLSKKPGTMSHWMGTFVGPRAGKFIGVFMLYVYFPIIIFALSMWGAEKVLMTSNTQYFTDNPWGLYGGTISLGLLFLFMVYLTNIWSTKGSKAIGTTGMFLKTIPLFTVIVMAFIALGMGQGQLPTTNPVDIAPDSSNDFNAIILALPGIMFAFDGFVYSASMQNEAKTDKTFMTAWVGGMIFVIAIYITYSFSIMVFVTDGYEFTLVAALKAWLPDNVEIWMIPLMESIVVISILSGLNGQIIGSSKSMASLSAENIMPDYRGTYVRLNRTGRPQFAQYKLLAITLGWMGLLVSLDAINMATGGAATHMSATNYASDITAVVSFTAYAVIMLGGMWNRRTGKVEVEKKSYFMATAAIASAGLLFIAGFQFYNVLVELFSNADWMPFVVVFLMIAIPGFLMWKFSQTIDGNPETKRRAKALERFYKVETDPIFKDAPNYFMFTYPKSKDPKYAHLRNK